jgi:hypothetical protein
VPRRYTSRAVYAELSGIRKRSNKAGEAAVPLVTHTRRGSGDEYSLGLSQVNPEGKKYDDKERKRLVEVSSHLRPGIPL